MNQLLIESNIIFKDFYDIGRYKYIQSTDYLVQRLGAIKKTRADSGFHSIMYNERLLSLQQKEIVYDCMKNKMYQRLVSNDDDIIATKKLIREYRN